MEMWNVFDDLLTYEQRTFVKDRIQAGIKLWAFFDQIFGKF